MCQEMMLSIEQNFVQKVFIEEEKMMGDIYLDIVEQGYPITVKMAVEGWWLMEHLLERQQSLLSLLMAQ